MKDPGALARALQLTAGTPVAAGHELSTVPSLEELAERLRDNPVVVPRLRRLGVADAIEAVHDGTSVLAPLDAAWLVARPEGGVLISSHGERSLPLRRSTMAKHWGEGAREVILLEPTPGLQSLTADAIGSDSPWRRLRALISLEGKELFSLLAYALVLGALSLALPVATQVLVNTIAFGTMMQPLVVLALLLFGVLAIAGLVRLLQWYAVELLQRRLFVRIAEDFARRLPRVTREAHARKDVRELSNRFFDVVSLQKASAWLLLDGLGLALQTVVGMVLLGFYHPMLLAFDVVLVIALIGVVALGRGAVSSAVEESAAKYRVAAWLQEVAASPPRFADAEGALLAMQRADLLTRDYLTRRKTHYGRLLRQLVGGVGLQVLAMSALLGLGGWLVIERELTLGQLVAAELVVGAVAAGFVKLGKHFETAYDLLAAVDKVGKVLDLPVRPDPTGAAASPGEAA
ncbi:MAG: ABC transporter transmembrane domain-containing protein [Myxococcales bacterium]